MYIGNPKNREDAEAVAKTMCKAAGEGWASAVYFHEVIQEWQIVIKKDNLTYQAWFPEKIFEASIRIGDRTFHSVSHSWKEAMAEAETKASKFLKFEKGV